MSTYSEEQIVDVEKRTREVGQVLADPTLFPVEFLSWLKRYIEQSGIQLPASSIIGGFKPGSGSLRNLAAGIIIPFGGGTPPSGSLLCDGTAFPRDTYPFLTAEIETKWGNTAGAPTIKTPDLVDRTLFGAGGQLALGQTDGQPLASRQAWRHGHSFNLTVYGPPVGSTQAAKGPDQPYDAVAYNFGNQVVTGSVGPPGANQDGPNYAGVLYVITTGS